MFDQQVKNPQRQKTVNIIYQGLGDTFSLNPGGYSHYFLSSLPSKTFSLLGVNSKEELRSYSLLIAGEQQGQCYMALAQKPLVIDEHATGSSDKSEWMKHLFQLVIARGDP